MTHDVIRLFAEYKRAGTSFVTSSPFYCKRFFMTTAEDSAVPTGALITDGDVTETGTAFFAQLPLALWSNIANNPGWGWNFTENHNYEKLIDECNAHSLYLTRGYNETPATGSSSAKIQVRVFTDASMSHASRIIDDPGTDNYKTAGIDGKAYAALFMRSYYWESTLSTAGSGVAYFPFYVLIDSDKYRIYYFTATWIGGTSQKFSLTVTRSSIFTDSTVLANLRGIQPVLPTNDPYATPGGSTQPGGGGGDYRLVDDPIDFPTVPTISVADAGFVSIWVPDVGQLRDLAQFMWNADPLKIDFWKKMIANPIDLILGLQLLPFTVDTETNPARVTLGIVDSGIDMYYTDVQFHEIDCGELDLSEYWGAFLDYAPYTDISIYLPFIGVRPLNINDCMPKTIHVKYYVDIVTGTCVALIKCGSSLFYHFSGSCAAQVPITSGQAQQLFGKALSLATGIAAAAATGGIAGALAATVGASSTVASAGGMVGADRSGSLTGTAGFMDSQTPYLIISRPRQAVPDGQNELTGYPSFITTVMSELTGYTEIQVTHLHNMSCTDVEIAEIIRLLGEGVIF